MLFGIEYDHGSILQGYVVTDGVNGSVDCVAKTNGETIYEFTANELREALVHSGRHATGACGFTLSTEHIADIGTLFDFEIRTRDDLLIYHRPSYDFIGKKILRLETQMLPLWRFDHFFEDKFQYYLNNIENHGRETTTQFFLLNGVNSQYLSGRILFKNYMYYTENNYDLIAMLQDPYNDLAERLFVMKQLQKTNMPHLSKREIASLAPAIEFVENLKLNDDKAIIKAFKNIPDDVATLLSDPVTRLLTTSTPGEAIARNATASALDTLSSFAIVGLREHSDRYCSACAELIGVDYNALPPVPQFTQVEQLATVLKQSKQAGYLIEKDRELYSTVSSVYNKA